MNEQSDWLTGRMWEAKQNKVNPLLVEWNAIRYEQMNKIACETYLPRLPRYLLIVLDVCIYLLTCYL